ncbi:MAG: GAF domain-containing protein [Acidobacteriia bacterium]|nr:GAF domain-containing protein [Terriglobia bacterium]
MQSLGPSPAESGATLRFHAGHRRCVRHQLNTPAHVSLARNSASHPIDLHEIVNLSELGMAIQAVSSLELNYDEEFCLDLSEMKGLVRVAGRVVWYDQSGRIGIQFAELPEMSRRALRGWLLANAPEAGVQQAVDADPIRQDSVDGDGVQATAAFDEYESVPPDYTTLLTALAAVRREVESLGADLDAALHLIARRAAVFTRATGTAIALIEGPDMVCRATAGPDTPALGAQLRVGSGFSGECVRSDKLLRCDDSEIDPRADRESCRVLGIRSMAAAPIRDNGNVVGLLEVFAREPNAFGSDEEIVLQHLAEVASAAARRAAAPASNAPRAFPASVDDEFPVETPMDLPLPQLSPSRNLLLVGAAATVVLVIVWLIGPWSTNDRNDASPLPAQVQSQPVSQPANIPLTAYSNLEGLRKLAQQGDPAAQFALGARYATGEEVPQNYAEACRWFSEAAERGNVTAQATLGTYYEVGRGVLPDLERAYYWSFLAQVSGDEASKSHVSSLAMRLSHRRIAAAQQQAKEWLKQHQAAPQSAPAP